MNLMASTLEYAKAKGATTLLDNALIRLWTKQERSRENCIRAAACLLYANVRITKLLESIGCKPTDEEVKEVYDDIVGHFDDLGKEVGWFTKY